jgi:hypothetical protein
MSVFLRRAARPGALSAVGANLVFALLFFRRAELKVFCNPAGIDTEGVILNAVKDLSSVCI